MINQFISKRISRSVLAIGLYFCSITAHANYELSCKMIPELFRAFLTQHIVHKSLTPELHARSMDQYVKQMDPTKMYLLESDIGVVKKKIQKLFMSLSKDDCSELNELQSLLIKRVEENEAIVKKLLSNEKFKIDESIAIALNPEKRSFAKNIAERTEMLRKSIHFQMWNYLSTEVPLAEAKEKLIHRYERTTKRVRELKQTDLYTNFINAFTSTLDPHTNYFSKEGKDDFDIDMSLSLEGIGASLSSDDDGYTVVEEIIAGGAADRAKVLQPKDKIIAVSQSKDGKPQTVINMDLSDVVRLIRGKKGTSVFLKLLRKEAEGTKQLEVTIVRDKVDLKESAARIDYFDHKMGNNRKIKLGVIELPSFYGNAGKGARSAYEDMKKLIEEANKEKVDGLVLNLSRNGGGLLDGAVQISGLFIKEGAIVATLSQRKDVSIMRDSDPQTQFKKPLVVLTSRVSASASEILAGALKDYDRALIVGADNTFGKGTVQAVLDLPPNLGSMKVTTGMFFVPGGNSTQNLGILGDVILPSPLNTDDFGEKKLDNALPPMKINSFKSKNIVEEGPNAWKPINKKIRKSLAEKSSTRVAQSEDFKKIQKDILEMKKDEGIVKLADLIQKDKKDSTKKKEDEEKSNRERIKDLQKPYIDESLNVLADLVEALNPNAGKIMTAIEMAQSNTEVTPVKN